MPHTLENIRHSLAHLLAAAVLDLWPDTKLTIGPAIENGFYYDFEFSKPVSDEDLPKIEKKMRQIGASWKKFSGKKVSGKEARELFKHNPYKLELIAEIVEKKEPITLYTSGEFTDLCRGGHVENMKDVDLNAFKLTRVAGAYWRGDEKNPMLTRIYGVAFSAKKELDEHLAMLEEAKKRDHKVLGPRLGLFDFHETAPGMPYWLPKGLSVLNTLIDFWRHEHHKRGYQEIATPLINKKQLYVTSGHWDHYQENMFISETEEGEIYALKPMNCPNAMVVYGMHKHSYRELPLRLSDTDPLHRFERSGTLNGLLRVRSFRQDDAHIFVTPEQIKDEVSRIFEITERFYSLFGMEYSFRLGTRPEKFMGEPRLWDRAEKELKDILKKSKKAFFILEGDGAFYGPKVDIIMKDALGREWQMGTIQLDFQIPLKFNLTYVDKDGSEKTPVAIHRVIYGSLERFIGILIEHTAGEFPAWLAPVQIALLPVSAEKHLAYCRTLADELAVQGTRVWIDESDETVGKKIRGAEQQKIPYMLVIGDKEMAGEKLAVRKHGEREMSEMSAMELLKKLQRN